MNKLDLSIPTWSPSKQWHYTTFENREEFRDYIKSIFKQPGEYRFDETVLKFNEQSQIFTKKGIYCNFQETSNVYIKYWDAEKEKCRKGVIFKNDKGDEWYLARFYYHWINFLQVYHKQMNSFQFPDVRDLQYHVSLYKTLAWLFDMNSATLKSRQKGMSYLHIAEIFNKYIFEQGYVAKIGASDKKYIEGNNGCWRYLNQYKNFTNSKTAWIRYNDPDKVFSWEQKVKLIVDTEGGKVDRTAGTFATISGVSFDKDPAAGVGGAVDDFYYEEGGVAPTADITYGYIKDALKEGGIKTGMFSISGSVGELDQCEPLKELMLNPVANEIYPVTTDLLGNNEGKTENALFIPVFWGMPPHIDIYGNSLVEQAKIIIDKEYAEKKRTMLPHLYRLSISQGPRTISEAFATRSDSIFPLRYTAAQLQRIEDKEYFVKHVDLYRDEGAIKIRKSECKPIEFTGNFSDIAKLADKRSCGEMHEEPKEGRTYKAAVDPVQTGSTTSSESLACVIVCSDSMEVTKTDDSGQQITYIEGGKIVFCWWGRYDDIDDTNDMLSMVLELYNAKCMCENNVDTFIQFMRYKKRQRYLALTKDMIFDKDIDDMQTSTREYGIYMTDRIKSKLLEYAINFLGEKIGSIKREEDNEKEEKVIYGVERIGPFIGIIKQMMAYTAKGNFDQVVTFAILIGYIRSTDATRGGIQQVIEYSPAQIEAGKKSYEQLMNKSPFRNMGRQLSNPSIRKSAFRNMH